MAKQRRRNYPVLHLVDGQYRIVSNTGSGIPYKALVLLLLLYAHPKSAQAKDLQLWTGYRNYTQFKTSVLKKLHDQRLAHFEEATGEVSILPPGCHYVVQRWPELFSGRY